MQPHLAQVARILPHLLGEGGLPSGCHNPTGSFAPILLYQSEPADLRPILSMGPTAVVHQDCIQASVDAPTQGASSITARLAFLKIPTTIHLTLPTYKLTLLNGIG